MIPTYTYAIKDKIIKDYLTANMAVILINNSNLGITDTPTPAQLEARRTFNASQLNTYEIGASNLNGYRRDILNTFALNTTTVSVNQTELSLSASFTAVGNDLDPFTHIVVLRGANTNNINATLNGNNRGDTNGTIIFIEPVSNSGLPFVLNQGSTFNYTFKLINATQII